MLIIGLKVVVFLLSSPTPGLFMGLPNVGFGWCNSLLCNCGLVTHVYAGAYIMPSHNPKFRS